MLSKSLFYKAFELTGGFWVSDCSVQAAVRLSIRRRTFYPAEVQAHENLDYHSTNVNGMQEKK